MKGIDFAWGLRPGLERAFARAIKAEGFGFVVRYLSSDPSKNLTRAEVAAYKAEGLDIVTVYEDAAAALAGGAAVGRGQALAARAQLSMLSAPDHAPVYFAADFPASGGQIAEVDAALDATAYILSEENNGIYGDYAVVSGATHVAYRWQTVAWSAGQWDHADDLRQYAQGGVTLAVHWDLDTSLVADFGQWKWAAPAPPLAPPKPRPNPVKVVKKAASGTKSTVSKQPVVSASTAAAALSAAAALLAKHVGLHLTATQLHSIVTALPALAALFSAWKVRPTSYAILSGAITTITAAAASFGLNLSAGALATLVPLITLAYSGLTAPLVTPTSATAAAGPAEAVPVAAAPAPAPLAPMPAAPVPVAVAPAPTVQMPVVPPTG